MPCDHAYSVKRMEYNDADGYVFWCVKCSDEWKTEIYTEEEMRLTLFGEDDDH